MTYSTGYPSWGIYARASLRWCGLSSRLQGRSTFGAELGRGLHLLAAPRAEPNERHPTFGAKLGSLSILRVTAWAVHGGFVLHQPRWRKEKIWTPDSGLLSPLTL